MRVELANLSQRIRMRDNQGAEDKLEEIKDLVEDSLGVVRNMALLLRPSMLDDLGLVPALQWQGREEFKRTGGLRVRVAAAGVSDDLPEEHKTCIYRIVQESLHNCAQHALRYHCARDRSDRSRHASGSVSRMTAKASKPDRNAAWGCWK